MKIGRRAFGSWSTFGQIALLISAALLVSQMFAFFLLRNFIDQWQHSAVVGPSIARFAEVAHGLEATAHDARAQFLSNVSVPGKEFRLVRTITLSPMFRERSLESDLIEALNKHGVRYFSVFAVRHGGHRGFGPRALREEPALRPPMPLPPDGLTSDTPLGQGTPTLTPLQREPGPMPPWGMPGAGAPFHPFGAEGAGGPPPGRMNEEILLTALLPDGNWLVGRFVATRPLPLFLNPIFISESVLFVTLLAISLFWASRISRPLRMLSRAAENLRPQEQLELIAVEGPRDVRAAITSFNTMARRVRDLLQEKDRMLSAIGHDLRTPLASLRIRAESVEPQTERERLVETIEEMTLMVEEILGLARLGHSSEPRVLVDLSALADSLVEEYRELGEEVTFEEAPRMPVEMQVGPVRRLLRNLIDNAIKYGERARVSVRDSGQAVELRVDDDGPGIPPGELATVIEPFTRLENSRSRATGGLGLGLSIAHALARSQGAELILENRTAGGLRASVRWPRTSADPAGVQRLAADATE